MNLFSETAIIMNPESGPSAASNYNPACIPFECRLLFREHLKMHFGWCLFISFIAASIISNAKGN